MIKHIKHLYFGLYVNFLCVCRIRFILLLYKRLLPPKHFVIYMLFTKLGNSKLKIPGSLLQKTSELSREKANNLGFRPGPTQTSLYCHRMPEA